MRAVHFACTAAVLLSAGCGAAGASTRTASEQAAEQARAAHLEKLEARSARQQARLRELEGQLALAQAEVEQLRAREARGDALARQTVRIASETDEDADSDPTAPPGPSTPPPSADDGPRPLLRLYGDKPSAEASPTAVPDVPEGLPSRLPVAPLPDSDVPTPSLLAGAQAVAPPRGAEHAEVRPDAGVRAYRKALALVRDRKFSEAESAFRGFLERYGSHPYADHARYWLAEVLYALRRYPDALRAFGAVARAADADEDRVAEAMLKMGLCEKHLGRPDRAQTLFNEVRQRFPHSVAARLASEEDAS